MRLLIVFGAGASYDCIERDDSEDHFVGYELPDLNSYGLPLASQLFDKEEDQQKLLKDYSLISLADRLHEIQTGLNEGNSIDIEEELQKINDEAVKRNDEDALLELFLCRFYLNNLIVEAENTIVEQNSGDNAYVRFLGKIKEWTLQKPGERFVDIVNFNYDSLLEGAVETVYPSSWNRMRQADLFQAYNPSEFVHIYKPHGSINWGREFILKSPFDTQTTYRGTDELAQLLPHMELKNSFKWVDENHFSRNVQSSLVPAIAVPFKSKTDFSECPPEMFAAMKAAVLDADKLLTIGWKGADNHFVKLLETNTKITTASVVSPFGDSALSYQIKPIMVGFSKFVYGRNRIDTLGEYLSDIDMYSNF